MAFFPRSAGFTQVPGTNRWTNSVTSSPVPSLPSPTAVATSTGVNPVETSYSLYGHIIPLSVLGVGRIGGEIISGPWVANGRASFIISFGVPADPSGTRTLREIAFDSEVVWTSSGGFINEGFTFRFYGGTLTQAADPLETTHFGANAIAYRPQILIAFENLPLANTKFGKVPYVAAVVADSSGDDVNLGEAFERLAYSPWVGYTSNEFETSGITDGLVNGGLIFAQDAEFLSTIQSFGRFYRAWDILQTDKLRIVDRGNIVAADIVLDLTTLTDQVTFTRVEQGSVPRELELATIDPEADYTIVPSKAARPREPVNVSASVSKESQYLPAIMDSSTRQAIVTYAKYQEEAARKKVSGTAMIYGLEIEPGDLVAIADLGDEFQNEIFKIDETSHGANNVVEFEASSILRCAFGIEEQPIPAVVGLALIYSGNGATQSITGAGFQPDLVAIKARDAVTGWRWLDSSRGPTKSLNSSNTGAEVTEAAGLTSFDADGFSLGSDADYNANGLDFFALCLKKVAGAFDIVTYTGNGSAGHTVAHGLGVVPEFMVVRNLSTAGANWAAYPGVVANPWTKFLQFQTTIPVGTSSIVWNDTAPTSSVFSVGTSTSVNTNGANYVAWLFASKPGAVDIGSYTGNGTSTGPFVTTGFRPRFIIVKMTSGSGAWKVIDRARDPSSPHGIWTSANSTSVEKTFGGFIFDDTGFQFTGSDEAAVNTGGETYMYIAIA